MVVDNFLPPSVYTSLIALVPSILEWLRDRNLLNASKQMHAAAVYINNPKSVPRIQQEAVQNILSYLAAEIDKGPISKARKRRGKLSKFPSNIDLNVLMVSNAQDLTLWYVAILLIMSQADPRAVPMTMLSLDVPKLENINGNALFETLKQLNTVISRDFSYQSVYAFAEVCSILRDSLSLSGESNQLRSVGNTIGKVLIGGDSSIGGNTMRICIKYCYSLFTFLPQKNSNWQVRGYRTHLPKGTDKVSTQRLVVDKLRRDLATFYELKDANLVNSVSLLMNSYSIFELALGILLKYGCLPLGWKEYLEKEKQNKLLDWFSPKLAYISDTVVVTQAKFYIPRQAKKRYEALKTQYGKDKLNITIKELITNKMDYVKTLDSFLNEFVSEIRFIASSEVFGTEAKTALGITEEQIEMIMGESLSNILTVERKICADLEALSILPCEVKQSIKRSGLLCKILLKHRDQTIKAYTEYGVMCERTTDLFRNLTSNANKQTNQSSIHLHFEDIYNELRQTNKAIDCSMEIVLQKPVGYLTTILLYLDRMKKHIEKELTKSHPSYSFLCDSIPKYKKVCETVDQGIREGKGQEKGKRDKARTPGLPTPYMSPRKLKKKLKRGKGSSAKDSSAPSFFN